MTLFHGEFCFFDFCSPSSCAALLPKESFGRELSLRQAVTVLFWCTAGGRHDGPQSLKRTAWNQAALCSTSAFLHQLSCGPSYLPLDQGSSALKNAHPSVKREKKEPLIHIAPTEDCAPTAGETNTELSSW